jgi:2-polyprenyl-3-methyl-5-hydroxy-6-metoxy-1,4-benzoquinol methylase
MPRGYPLDLEAVEYSYVERPNSVLVAMATRALTGQAHARLLDVGCGAGANGRALKAALGSDALEVHGIEPNPRAAEEARAALDSVFTGYAEAWLAQQSNPQERDATPFDAVLLSDVVEHVPDPLGFLAALAAHPPLRGARWFVSVPNYAVWYNRIRTLFGRFDYAWSGLYDRTHLRFFTRQSIQRLLDEAGFEVEELGATPSLVQSTAPLFRTFFDKDVTAGKHLTLGDSPAYRAYARYIEPVETAVCGAWPALLAFQIVVAARLRETS